MIEKRQGSVAGGLYLCLIGLMVALMGALFMGWLWKSYEGARETRGWDQVEASILESGVRERKLGREIPKEYSLSLLYEYEYEGVSYTGDHLKRRENPWYKEKGKILGEVGNWQVGVGVMAFVNPKDPEEAVLEHDSKAGGYSIWFPGLFVVGGLGIVVAAIRKMLAVRKTT